MTSPACPTTASGIPSDQRSSRLPISEERLRRFVGDASHELRTPLTAVRGYADLYHAGGLSDPEELSRVVRSVTHGQVDMFVRLYARAHAQGAARTP